MAGLELVPYTGQLRQTVQETSFDPDTQVADTISLMRRYVCEDSQTPQLQAEVLLAEELGDGDVVTGAWLLAKRRLIYSTDSDILAGIRPHGSNDVECLIRPIDVFLLNDSGELVRGDCDDFSMYVAAILRAAGLPAWFRTSDADSNYPGMYGHVYVVTEVGGVELAVDASHGPQVGWEAPNKGRVRDWPLQPITEAFTLLVGVVIVLIGFDQIFEGYKTKANWIAKLYDRVR